MSCKGNGVIRMTEKRFECDKGSRIIIDNETKLHYIMTLDWECSLVTKLLNRFAEENEQLKIELIKQNDFKDKVFNLINTKLKEADEGFKMTYDSWYQGQVDALKELKKELITGKSK